MRHLQAATLAAALALAGCSGRGGGGGGACSATVACPGTDVCIAGTCRPRSGSDTVAPTLVSVTPASGAIGVWVRAPIQATFSEPMRLANGAAGSARVVVDGVEVASTASVSPDGTTVTVVPAPFVGPASVHVALPWVTDLAGNLPAQDVSWSYTCPLFVNVTPPGQTSTTAGVHAVDVALDGAAAYAIGVVEHFAAADEVRAYRYAGGAWSGSPNLEDMPNAPQAHQTRVAARGGAVMAGWWAKSGTTAALRVRAFDGAAWQPVGGDPTAGTLYLAADLALGPDGTPVVAWDTPDGIQVRRWSGTSWDAVGAGVGAAASTNPRLAVDAGGAVILAYLDASQVAVARWDGAGWTALGGALGGVQVSTERLGLALDAAGHPTVAFGTAEGLALRTWDGSSWSAATAVVLPATGTGAPDRAMGPVLSVAPDGETWLAYAGETTGTVFLARLGASGVVARAPEDWGPAANDFGIAAGTGDGPFLGLPGAVLTVHRYDR